MEQNKELPIAKKFKVLDDVIFEVNGKMQHGQIRSVNYIDEIAHVWFTLMEHPFNQYSKNLYFHEMKSKLPTAPKEFPEVERYVSHLPLERVKFLREIAYNCLNNGRHLTTVEEILAGYIMELTQGNK